MQHSTCNPHSRNSNHYCHNLTVNEILYWTTQHTKSSSKLKTHNITNTYLGRIWMAGGMLTCWWSVVGLVYFRQWNMCFCLHWGFNHVLVFFTRGGVKYRGGIPSHWALRMNGLHVIRRKKKSRRRVTLSLLFVHPVHTCFNHLHVTYRVTAQWPPGFYDTFYLNYLMNMQLSVVWDVSWSIWKSNKMWI